MIFRSTYKKPLLLVGNGVRSADAADEVIKFIKKTNIPVLTSMNAVDLVQDEHKIGFAGVYGNRVANMLISECDLLIAVGIRLGLRQTCKNTKKFAPNAHLIRADVDMYELSRTVKTGEDKYLIDAKEFLIKLNSEEIPDYSGWLSKCIKLKNILDGYDDLIGNMAVKEISKLLPENPIVTVDVGQNMCWCAQSLHLKGRDGRILMSCGYGSMGCSMPYAVGASIASNNSKVFCITGDGGFQMNIHELETIVRESLPIKILILNNKVLGKISEIQSESYGQRFAQTTKSSGYSVPDFEKIALAYGIKAITLKDIDSLRDHIDWFNDNEPCVMNILLPQDTKVIPKMDFNTLEISPKLNNEIHAKWKDIINSN